MATPATGGTKKSGATKPRSTLRAAGAGGFKFKMGDEDLLDTKFERR
jgi:hypothetical protein